MRMRKTQLNPIMPRTKALLSLAALLVMSSLARAIPPDPTAPTPPASRDEAAEKIVASYPEFLARVDGPDLVWNDGTRMSLDDGKGKKPFEAWLATPDITDMLEVPYPVGEPATAPEPNHDPGRARNAAFFDKMYGDCRKGEVTAHLTTITWLAKKAPQRLQVTRINGVADRLQKISDALDTLPTEFDKYLIPSAGTYNCRPIAGTDRMSAHGHGIAIDIATKQSHFWKWSAPDKSGALPYKNEIPKVIIDIFERHGFIWGGRWYHYDTMHFEYRPELLPVLKAAE